jgi:hypothetical protein
MWFGHSILFPPQNYLLFLWSNAHLFPFVGWFCWQNKDCQWHQNFHGVLQRNFARCLQFKDIFWSVPVSAFTVSTKCYRCIAEHEVSFTFSLYDRGYLISKSPAVSSLSSNFYSWHCICGTCFIWHICFQMDPSQTSVQDGKTLHPYDKASEKLFSVSILSLACRFHFRFAHPNCKQCWISLICSQVKSKNELNSGRKNMIKAIYHKQFGLGSESPIHHAGCRTHIQYGWYVYREVSENNRFENNSVNLWCLWYPTIRPVNTFRPKWRQNTSPHQLSWASRMVAALFLR